MHSRRHELLGNSLAAYCFIVLPLSDLGTGALLHFGHLDPGSLGSPSQIARAALFPFLLLSSFSAYQLLPILASIFLMIAVATEIRAFVMTGSFVAFLSGLVMAAKFCSLQLAYSAGKALYFTPRVFFQAVSFGLVVVSLSLIVSALLGVGSPTYTSGGFGTKGFFPSGNSLGLHLGVCTLVLLAGARKGLYKPSMLTIAILILAMLLVASRTSLVLMLLCSFIYISSIRVNSLLKFLLVLGIALLIIFNIEALQPVLEIALRRYEAASGDYIHFLLSGRLGYVIEATDAWLTHIDFWRPLFGGGGVVAYEAANIFVRVDLLEMDLVDMLFMYGFFGVAIYLALWANLMKFVRDDRVLLLAVSIVALHSVFLGHVAFSGLGIPLILAITVTARIYEEERYVGTFSPRGHKNTITDVDSHGQAS